MDGTDFRIYEPSPFDAKWYSHKFKGPGVRYEVGVCIATGHIVWIHGPFPCGSWPDLRIFRDSMQFALDDGELALADGGYRGCRSCETPSGLNDFDQKMKADARARHETVNRRFKHFFVLGHRFRHPLSRHSACFRAVANLTQLMIQNGEPLFDVDYT